ncbi:MAG: hypothetical protein HYU36_00720 [Planctomycetes bacterium]|nr:hypothetical protein [Planctomycetota bacterium]
MSRIISRGPGLRSRPQPPGFLPEADAWFDLHGALVEYFKGRPVDFANAPDFDDWEWDQYLKRLFPDRLCARWQKRTPTAIYTVVLVRASC